MFKPHTSHGRAGAQKLKEEFAMKHSELSAHTRRALLSPHQAGSSLQTGIVQQSSLPITGAYQHGFDLKDFFKLTPFLDNNANTFA